MGRLDATQIEEHAAVLLKDAGILPLSHARGRIAVVGDAAGAGPAASLAGALAGALADDRPRAPTRVPAAASTCSSQHVAVRAARWRAKTVTFTAPATGAYVARSRRGATRPSGWTARRSSRPTGSPSRPVQRTALVHLTRGARYTFASRGRRATDRLARSTTSPSRRGDRGVRGARAAVVVAYDLRARGWTAARSTLPNAQDAVISAVAAKVPTVVAARDGRRGHDAVARPVDGVLEVWNPTGMVQTDATLSQRTCLRGPPARRGRRPERPAPRDLPRRPRGARWRCEASGRASTPRSTSDLPPNGGVGIGYAWYRTAGWPVLFPFGFGLSYTSYQLLGAAR